MTYSPLYLSLLALYLFVINSNAETLYKKNADGVTIELSAQGGTGVRTVNLQVIDAGIVRVTASPTESLSLKPGLMCSYLPKKVSWNLVKQGDTLTLRTSKLHAKVSSKTGEVVFTDA